MDMNYYESRSSDDIDVSNTTHLTGLVYWSIIGDSLYMLDFAVQASSKSVIRKYVVEPKFALYKHKSKELCKCIQNLCQYKDDIVNCQSQ